MTPHNVPRAVRRVPLPMEFGGWVPRERWRRRGLAVCNFDTVCQIDHLARWHAIW